MQKEAIMGIVAAYAVPHPPLIIPTVGRGEEKGIQATINSYKEIARRICALQPEVIVVSSPHAPLYRDGFHVTTDNILEGSMKAFMAPKTRVSVDVDTSLASEIIANVHMNGIATVPSTWRDRDMDHATFIPLYFVQHAYEEAHKKADFKVVRVGLSGLPFETHKVFGQEIARSIEVENKRCVFIASGDLSHKLKSDGPYGFASEGPQLDEQLCEIFKTSALDKLFSFSEDFCERAAECGVRSFQIMAGALEELSSSHDSTRTYSSELLSYEGPFGVGYAVAAFERRDDSTAGDVSTQKESSDDPLDVGDSATDKACSKEDPYVALARSNIECYIRTGKPLVLDKELQDSLPEEMLTDKAGVFVSIHKQGELRGCIGTIAPTTQNIAQEIIQNGISASTRDPRFPPIQEYELASLEMSVDVLKPAEPISSPDELDPERYGVIVSKGFRRGLLLPNLEGVHTVEEQLAIAKQKAGIRVNDKHVKLERFEVIRHE